MTCDRQHAMGSDTFTGSVRHFPGRLSHINGHPAGKSNNLIGLKILELCLPSMHQNGTVLYVLEHWKHLSPGELELLETVFGFVFDHKSYLVPPSIQTPPFFGY